MDTDYFDLPLIRPKTVHRRLYQEVIFAMTIKHNTLVVLPTGLGKTVIAVVLSAYQLEKTSNSKVVILAPTRPLVGQLHRRFNEMLLVVPEKLQIITGETAPKKRSNLWRKSSLIFMTPQTLRNDLEHHRYTLTDVSLLIFDEAHRATGRYDYVPLADYYINQCKTPRILALTASPRNVRALCEALYIENIEVRTANSPDLIQYIQRVDVEYIIVKLTPEFQKIEQKIRQGIQMSLLPVIELGLLKPNHLDFISRRDLLKMRREISLKLQAGQGTTDTRLYNGILGIALSLRLSHAREILQTQGIPQLFEYFQTLRMHATRPRTPRNIQILVSSSRFKEIYQNLEVLISKNETHPKNPVLIRILTEQLERNPTSRILVFTRFRVSAMLLTKYLNKQLGIHAARFVGQSNRPNDPGLRQKEQLAVLDAFRRGTFNVLVATNVGEEGLDVSECNLVVFYDAVPSAIRRIQRAGRTGRKDPGRIIALITQGSPDEMYHQTSRMRQQAIQSNLLHHARRLRPGSLP